MAFQLFDDPNVTGIAAPQQMGALSRLGLILQNIADPTTLPKYQESVQQQQMQDLRIAEINKVNQRESALAALAASPEFNSLDTAGKFSALAAIDPSYADDLLNYQASQEITPYQRAQLSLDQQRINAARSSGADLPSSIREYQYYSQLSPQEQQQYLGVKRAQQVVNLGGSYGVLGQDGRVVAELPKTLAPENLPEVRAQQTAASEQAKLNVEAQAALPSVTANAEQTTQLIDDLLKSPGLPYAVGASSVLPIIPGTAAADFNTRLEQIQGKQFLQAFESLKGGGQITEIEGKKATDAIARMSRAQTEEEFIKSANEFKGVVNTALERAKKKAGVVDGTSTPTVKRLKFDAQGNMVQ